MPADDRSDDAATLDGLGDNARDWLARRARERALSAARTDTLHHARLAAHAIATIEAGTASLAVEAAAGLSPTRIS